MWKWLLLGAGVLWYVTQREKAALPIAGNRAVSSGVDHVSGAVNKIIDEAGPAIGKWLGGLFSSSSSSSSYTSGGANTVPDYSNWGEDF